MNKKRFFFNLLYVVLIVSVIIFMIWIVGFMKGNAKECLQNPINYFESRNEGAVCSCHKNGIPYRSEEPTQQFQINLSEFEE